MRHAFFTEAARLRRNSRWAMRRRPAFVPRYWRNITAPAGLTNYTQRRDWLLVLNASRIPHILTTFTEREHVYVPPLLESAALRELRDFAAEGAAAEPSAPPLYIMSAWRRCCCR